MTREVLEATSAVTGYPVNLILSKSRQAPLAQARRICMWVMVRRMDWKTIDVAATMGRDHSTVSHHMRVITERERQRAEWVHALCRARITKVYRQHVKRLEHEAIQA